MKKIIITGSAGFVGFNLLVALNTLKYKTIAIDKNKNNLELIKKINSKVKLYNFDLSKRNKEWEKLFKNAYCVIQLQAQISHPYKEPYVRNNVVSIKNVVEACEKYKIKNLIHVSSSVVISITKDNYTNTKTKGEEIVKKSKIPYTILRLPLMYGCFNIKHLSFIIKKFEKLPIVLIPGSGKYIRQPLYVKDFVNIIIKLIEKKPQRKVCNIIGREKINFIDLIKIIFEEKKQKKIFINVPVPLFIFLLKIYGFLTGKKPFVADQLRALMAGDIFPVSKWEKEFGVKYTTFREGIRDTLNSKYYKYENLMKG